MARTLGRRGGRARARRLSAAQRQHIASLGGHARRRSFEVARRIEDTLKYAAALRELLPGRPAVRRVHTCRGPLPGVYPDR